MRRSQSPRRQAALIQETTSDVPPSDFFAFLRIALRGRGEPLIQESWNYRPLSIGAFFGLAQGTTLIDDWIREDQGVAGGIQLGWDPDYYWGLETRFTWAGMDLIDSERAVAAQTTRDDARGYAANDPYRHRFNGVRNNQDFFWDVHTLIYPWGDSAVRPYLLVGLGATKNRFIDRTDTVYKNVMFTIPVGVGMKCRINDFVALRVECADYIATGGGSTFDVVQHFFVTGGMELRFGGARRAYWPWNPGRHYW